MRQEIPAAGIQPALASHAPLGLGAFVALLAALMALNALATDIMLPGLPQMVPDLGAADTTEMQKVITAYLLGFGIGQIFIGVVTDRFGRRRPLIAGLAVYLGCSLFVAAAPDMQLVLVARFLQGLGASTTRVITTATVRDCYAGRRMARVMSLTMMVFMAAPVIAPGLGQLILAVASWRVIFVILAVYSGALLVICLRRYPETLPPERRLPIRADRIRAGLASVLGNRQTVGYTLAAGTVFGGMFGYINSSQQLLVDVYGLGTLFPAVFAITAAALAVTAFVNARLVERLGMRFLSHGASCGYVALALAMTALEAAGLLGIWPLVLILIAMTLLMGLIFANFNALAMAPQGRVAGIAASLTGAGGTVIGALIGYVIGQAFDGSAMPLALGFTLSGSATLILILIAEKGRLFRRGDPLTGL
ncbi:MAG: Bcr/CflA family drug resistance efflux transporter [Paracoccaceae bacterium]|nr:MAG: Bcr/CflA family efflux MFS transporter [Alphaproteobacteria bacterium]GIX12827.1 MAG: Bcr/CflA family drug resistance efflux transporter [Paracoccaceae bacterium]